MKILHPGTWWVVDTQLWSLAWGKLPMMGGMGGCRPHWHSPSGEDALVPKKGPQRSLRKNSPALSVTYSCVISGLALASVKWNHRAVGIAQQ